MPTVSPDRAVAAVERFGLGEYRATVRDEGHPGANAGREGRSYTLRLERVLVVGRPCDSPGCAASANPYLSFTRLASRRRPARRRAEQCHAGLVWTCTASSLKSRC